MSLKLPKDYFLCTYKNHGNKEIEGLAQDFGDSNANTTSTLVLSHCIPVKDTPAISVSATDGSMGLPEISRVTWQLCIEMTVLGCLWQEHIPSVTTRPRALFLSELSGRKSGISNGSSSSSASPDEAEPGEDLFFTNFWKENGFSSFPSPPSAMIVFWIGSNYYSSVSLRLENKWRIIKMSIYFINSN